MNDITRIVSIIAGVFVVVGLSHAADPPAVETNTTATTSPAVMPVTTPPPITEVLVGPGDEQVVFDGHVSSFEYLDAAKFQFTAGHGLVTTYVKQAADHLYFAFEIPEPTVHRGDDIVVMLNLGDPTIEKPTKNCIRAYVRRKMENSRMHKGDGEKWVNLYGEWEYQASSYAKGWEVEVRIPLAAVGAGDGQVKTLGLAYRIWDDKPLAKWNWPADADENQPSTWARLEITPANATPVE